jgi:predicted unusual protein kinase regulating ubiquinone biosynthesis (AarF/ABC1/UbiB family)
VLSPEAFAGYFGRVSEDEGSRLPRHLRARLRGTEGSASEAVDRAMNHTLERLGTGRIGRAAKLSKLAISGGRRALMDRARGALGTAREGEDGRGVAAASEMLRTFSELRGVSMKLGQMLSYLDDALPPEARKVLAVLQRDVSPMPWSAVRTVFEEDLGRAPEEVFERVDEKPIAAASIGQVHHAVLSDGREVALKIQYPGMAEAMRSDLKNARIFGLVQRLMAFSTDTEAIMSELEERFLDELDYRKEAAYQRAYLQRFAEHPVIVVPEVIDELSTERVLVTDFHHGQGFYEWLEQGPGEAERQRAVHTFYRFYLGSFYMDGLFNCDPHPGNYLFRDDGRIVFIDYGCCRRYPPGRIDEWIELCRAVCEDDRAGLGRVAQRLGFVRGPGTYDEDAFRDLMRYLYLPYLKDEPFAFADHRPQDTFRRMFVENANLFKLNMPADAVFLNRIGFGLVSLMAEMGGVLNVRHHVDAYFEGRDPDWPEDPYRGRRFVV